MREHLFRGKTEDGRRWVEGGFHKHTKAIHCPLGAPAGNAEDTVYLILQDGMADWELPVPIEGVEVLPETVGQYTGLEDRNGKKIFEGDIVRQETDYINRVVFFADADGRGWYTECERYGTEALYEYERVDASHKPVIYFDGVVIGNIWDNPDLLEVPHE